MTRRSGPTRTDALVAVGCGAVAVLLLLLLPVLAESEPGAADDLPDVGGPGWWAVLATLVAQAAVLAWRRRRPGWVAGAVAAAVPLAAAVGIGSAVGLTSLAVLVAVYTLATLRAPAQVWPVLTAAGVLVVTGHVVAGLRGDGPVGEALVAALVQGVVLVGAPLLVAALVVARRESRTAQEDRVAALEREQDALVRAAVDRERTAMARELHDIAAHHLTGIAVLSAAIAVQIDTDPAAAKAAVREVRRESTAVLRDLRSLVGLLRDHDSDDDSDHGSHDGSHDRGPAGAGVRVESLGGVPGLVADVAAGGQDVGLTVLGPTGDRAPGAGVGPLAQLAAYRMVQEALANAARHAVGARCEVEVDDRDPAALVVTVRNGPAPRTSDPAARGGLGLVGMRERAELTGSLLEVGPAPDGGWSVRLRVPRADTVGEEPT